MKLKSILITAVATLGLTATTMAQVTVTISTNGSTTICSGNSVQLTGNVSPSAIYQHQWVKNGVNITGANSTNYIANTSGAYTLKVTDLSSNVYNSNTINVTVNPLPTAPSVTYNSPAIICNGGSINLSDNSSTNVSYQWYLNNSVISSATNGNYNANIGGDYKLVITDITTGCSNSSQNVIVGEMPNIVDDTIVTCGNSTTISLTNSNFSYSTLPVACNVNMTNATTVSTNIGVSGGGGQRKIICYGGELTINGSGSNTFVVEYGGILNGFGGGGSNTAYIKAGGIYNFNSGGGGSNVVYYEPGAIINAGTTQTIQCNSIGVIYPPNATALCNNLTYNWSNGETTPTITVNPTVPATYTVTVSNGSVSCSDEVFVNTSPIVTLTALDSFTNINEGPIVLNGNPVGGVYSGSGIIGSFFDPQIAGLGNASINYIYTNGSGCIGNTNQSTIVYDTLGVVCTTYDTITTNVFDTLLTSVTDTLIINTLITGINPPNNLNTLKVFPNPASTHITIDYGNFNAMSGYTLTIINSIGQTVFTTSINQQTSYVDLSTWTGNGIYFVQLIDPQNNTIENKKIVIQ